jgi:hypothetical protein
MVLVRILPSRLLNNFKIIMLFEIIFLIYLGLIEQIKK